MIYSIHEDVPDSWLHIVDTFFTVATYNAEFNSGTPIDNVEVLTRNGKLHITYSGGDRVTDAFAFFAKEMSTQICLSCSLPATRNVFGSPKCDDCE